MIILPTISNQGCGRRVLDPGVFVCPKNAIGHHRSGTCAREGYMMKVEKGRRGLTKRGILVTCTVSLSNVKQVFVNRCIMNVYLYI